MMITLMLILLLLATTAAAVASAHHHTIQNFHCTCCYLLLFKTWLFCIEHSELPLLSLSYYKMYVNEEGTNMCVKILTKKIKI